MSDPVREGYDFRGWEDDDENILTSAQVNALTVTKSDTYTAQHDIVEYTITYKLNGGTNSDANPKTYAVKSADIAFESATRTGYTFDGWYDNDAFDGAPVTGIPTGSTGDKTLYAKFTPITYTVTFLGNGDETNPV